jgi:soluble lytic murein transglycosylase-like protein
MDAKFYNSKIKRTATQDKEAESMIRSIRRHVQKYEPSAALRLFNESGASLYLDDVEKDRIRAIVASGYLYAGKTDEAAKLSSQALRGSGAHAPMAGWVNGLAQWTYKNYDDAAQAFEVAAESEYATGSMIAASAYWAARAHQADGQDHRAKKWLEKAAGYSKTFYGLLASAALDKNVAMDWRAPTLTKAQEHDILKTAAGARAEKLLAAGEVTLAEGEIRSLYIRGDSNRKKALLAYAYDRKLPSLSVKLAHTAAKDRSDAALYPAMPWSPNKGYRIDRALLHAIARQESRFNAMAENKHSGATGLMQLMPNTAYHVVGRDIFRDYEGKSLLKNPEVSLDLGQKYVEELLNNSLIGQDLLSLAIAYNAGPGNLAKWKSERADMDDPLLFIETIPFAETRTYVERVMANYWIYRQRFNQNDESLQALADGKWARYAALDKDSVKFASAR